MKIIYHETKNNISLKDRQKCTIYTIDHKPKAALIALEKNLIVKALNFKCGSLFFYHFKFLSATKEYNHKLKYYLVIIKSIN